MRSQVAQKGNMLSLDYGVVLRIPTKACQTRHAGRWQQHWVTILSSLCPGVGHHMVEIFLAADSFRGCFPQILVAIMYTTKQEIILSHIFCSHILIKIIKLKWRVKPLRKFLLQPLPQGQILLHSKELLGTCGDLYLQYQLFKRQGKENCGQDQPRQKLVRPWLYLRGGD
jgi:hypothetical protein